MPRRELSFSTFDEALAEVDRLHTGGYEKQGQWNLAQICDHLTYFILGCLNGHQFRVPWIFKFLFGRMVIKRILGQRAMKVGVFTPQKPLPEPTLDEAGAVAKYKQAMERVRDHAGPFHASPFFGELTPQQWRDLHLIHSAHHLGFLTPKK